MTPAQFLHAPTPDEWTAAAASNLPLILLDHAHCEKKAASSALALLFRYPEHRQLVYQMSRLAREELRHFEQVIKLMEQRQIDYAHLQPSRYAAGLRQHMRTDEPARLVDTLIIGAYIEARSCERFEKLAPALADREIAEFYLGLRASESRHFRHYLELAVEIAGESIDERIGFFGEREAELNSRPDPELRFHSGPPARLTKNSAATGHRR